MNCFGIANAPHYPDDFFACSRWRNEEFKEYNTLNLYYIGCGSNENKTTRFREYHEKCYGVDDAKIRPVLKEYTDAVHLQKANQQYEIYIRIANGITTFQVNREELFSLPLAKGKGNGYFVLHLAEPYAFYIFQSKQNRQP